jgi:DUF971 family protein
MPTNYRINKIDLVQHIATGISDNLDGITPVTSIPNEDIIIRDGNNVELPYIETIGAYNITVVIRDSQNNTTEYSYDTYVTWSPDTVPPIVQNNNNVIFNSTTEHFESIMYIDFFNPPVGFITVNDIITFMGLSSFDDRGVSELFIKIYDQNSIEVTTIYNEGSYTIECTAVDPANNSTNKIIYLSVTLSPDILPPVITLTPNVTFNIVDSIWEANMTLDNFVGQKIVLDDIITANILSIVDNRPPYDIIPTITIQRESDLLFYNEIVQPDLYIIDILATDTSGNIDNVVIYLNVNLILDIIPPVITMLTPELYIDTVIEKSDILTLVESIYDQIDGMITPIDTMITIQGNISTILTPGDYSVNITAYDTAGNIASTDIVLSVILTPDVEPPVIIYQPIVNTLTNTAYVELATYPIVDISAAQLINDLILNITDNRSIGPFVPMVQIFNNNISVNNINAIGTYTVRFIISDEAGNERIDDITYNVNWTPDVIPPVITLKNVIWNSRWEATLYIDQYNGSIITKQDLSNYLIQSITDDRNNVLPNTIIYNSINESRNFINSIGEWKVTFNAIDLAGNSVSYDVFTTIEISPDVEPPYILWTSNVTNMSTTMQIDYFNNNIQTQDLINWCIYRIIDQREGQLTNVIVSINSITTTGVYSVDFTVSDSSLNVAIYTIDLTVVVSPDIVLPIITDNSTYNSNINMYVKSLYLDQYNNNILESDLITALNVQITDDRFGVMAQLEIRDLFNALVNNITIIGIYVINILAVDQEGNTASKVIQLTVSYSPDITPPQIYWNTTYVDPFSINNTTHTCEAIMAIEVFPMIDHTVLRNNLIDYIEDFRTGIITDSNINIRNSNGQMYNFINQYGSYLITVTTFDSNNNYVTWTVYLEVTTTADLTAPVITYSNNVQNNNLNLFLDQYGFIITKDDILSAAILSISDNGNPLPYNSSIITINTASTANIPNMTYQGHYNVIFRITDSANNQTLQSINVYVRNNNDNLPPELIWNTSGNMYIITQNPNIAFADLSFYGTITKEDIINDLVNSIIDYYSFTVITKNPNMINILGTNNQVYNFINQGGIYNIVINVNDSNNNYATYVVQLNV